MGQGRVKTSTEKMCHSCLKNKFPNKSSSLTVREKNACETIIYHGTDTNISAGERLLAEEST